MTKILIDARSLTKINHGGIAKVAELWIDELIKQKPEATYIFLTIGFKKNTQLIKKYKNQKVINLHFNYPNKLINFS